MWQPGYRILLAVLRNSATHGPVKFVRTLTPVLILAPGLAPGVMVISEVDLANNRVELVNTGATTQDLSTWWWCNRVNGSPFYATYSSTSTLIAGLSDTGSTLTSIEAGDTIVVEIASNFLPDVNGELGFYNTNNFGSASAIEDYVLWGANGIRDLVAQNAGLWTDNAFIDVSAVNPGETLQAIPGTDGLGPSEWVLAPSTLGASNIPEPTTSSLGALALIGLLGRRRRSS